MLVIENTLSYQWKKFRRLGYINDPLYKVELVKWETEYNELIIVGFFILQFAKSRMPELYYIFFEELEVDTDPFYLAISEYRTCLYVSNQQRKNIGTLSEVETLRMVFQPVQQQISSLVVYALSRKSTIDENVAYSKKNSAHQNWFVGEAKHFAVTTLSQTKTTLAAKFWKKERLETVVMDPCPNMAKFWKRLLLQHQQVEISANYNMLLPRMSKQRSDSHNLSRKKCSTRWKTHLSW